MPQIPVTSNLWTDAGLALALFIVGVTIAMKGDNRLGWIASLAGIIWAYLLFSPLV